MFQHQTLGIKVNIQVTKLVLLRQRPVSPVGAAHRKRTGSGGSGAAQGVVWRLTRAPRLCRWHRCAQGQGAGMCPGRGGHMLLLEAGGAAVHLASPGHPGQGPERLPPLPCASQQRRAWWWR